MSTENTPNSSQPVAFCRLTQIALLVALLMMAMGTGLFLWNEIRQKNSDVTLAKKVLAEYQTTSEPRIREFVAGLQAFAKNNPDFNPILAKYNLSGSTAAGSTTATPAPASPAKK